MLSLPLASTLALSTGYGLGETLIFVLDIVAIVSVLAGRGSVGHKVGGRC
jgi:hypothetical protein